jgi:hypothetical protein
VRALLATALALLVAAPAAGAATVARAVPAVGPVLAGDGVAWGRELRDGRLRVMRDRHTEVEVERATARDTRRFFLHTPWALAASGQGVAALVATGTSEADGDSVSTTEVSAVFGGPWGGARLLSGELTARGDVPCRDGRAYPLAVAVDGSRIAVAEVAPNCDTAEVAFRIVIQDGDATTVVFPDDWVRALDLAGDHIAWTVGVGAGDRLTVANRLTGAVERRIERSATMRLFEDIALTPTGAVAFTFRGRRLRTNLAYADGAKTRVLARGVADRGLAIAAGRVLYERVGRGQRSALVLRRLDGSAPRRLARFGPGHRRTGDLDLDASRATWAVGGPYHRIVLRHL